MSNPPLHPCDELLLLAAANANMSWCYGFTGASGKFVVFCITIDSDGIQLPTHKPSCAAYSFYTRNGELIMEQQK